MFKMNLSLKLWVILIISSISYSKSESNKKMLCYYGKWSEDRGLPYILFPQNIDATLCTHILYAFEMPDIMEGALPNDFLRSLTTEGGADEFKNLKKINPDLMLMLSVGGWKEGSSRFSKIASSPAESEWFAQYATQFIRSIGFDGLDINWQWPGQRRGGNPEDKKNYAQFIRTLKSYFLKEGKESGKPPLVLSVVLPPFKEMISKGFDMDSIAREVDFMTLLTMDYYGSTDPITNHHAPLHSVPLSFCNKELTVEVTVQHYLQLGIDPRKVILGIPMYGKSYLLESEYQNDIGSSSDDEGVPGFGTKAPGSLAYFEICKYLKDFGWKARKPNVTAMGPYAYYNKNWVAYDDVDIISRKTKFAVEKCLGGVMLWTIDMDDFKGNCADKFPLANAAKKALSESLSSCKISPSIASLKPFRIVTRVKWGAAQPTEEIPKLRISPAPYVIIAHTVSNPCNNFEECKPAIQNIQHSNIGSGFGDIGYNFLIGGDGYVYEGLGWDLFGSHTRPFNARSIGVAFIGNYNVISPNQKQIDAALRLLDEGVRLGKLTANYKVFGHKQVVALESPGVKLMEVIKTWEHWARYDPIEDD